jgi:hypothetical protein
MYVVEHNSKVGNCVAVTRTGYLGGETTQQPPFNSVISTSDNWFLPGVCQIVNVSGFQYDIHFTGHVTHVIFEYLLF